MSLIVWRVDTVFGINFDDFNSMFILRKIILKTLCPNFRGCSCVEVNQYSSIPFMDFHLSYSTPTTVLRFTYTLNLQFTINTTADTVYNLLVAHNPLTA